VIQGALATSTYHRVFPPTVKVFITTDPCRGDTTVYIVESTLFHETLGWGCEMLNRNHTALQFKCRVLFDFTSQPFSNVLALEDQSDNSG
jgi:hypothetical protein